MDGLNDVVIRLDMIDRVIYFVAFDRVAANATRSRDTSLGGKAGRSGVATYRRGPGRRRHVGERGWWRVVRG